ncbi:hypothetical protein PHMEG_0009416 [Phytophthora megakarya]|uniref:Uncharacterized protein n=1 Tax=Phytophthora megakarya TaxID=4795 RepID=A0A225WIQ0_9STRA|nr:hypothetical protein PHMEG_0009416 [Phytophthora megakarya]
MQDYDLYKEITSLSGCGICPESGRSLLDDDVWEKLIESKPSKLRGRIKEMRKNGFEHSTTCSLIADKLSEGARSSVDANVTKQHPPPPSHDRRVQTVKRIRDIASKSRRSKKTKARTL